MQGRDLAITGTGEVENAVEEPHSGGSVYLAKVGLTSSSHSMRYGRYDSVALLGEGVVLRLQSEVGE